MCKETLRDLMDREAWRVAVHGVAELDELVTEQSTKSGAQSSHSLVISIPGNRKALLLQSIIR